VKGQNVKPGEGGRMLVGSERSCLEKTEAMKSGKVYCEARDCGDE
jgi:hypothetical protein